MMPETTVFMGQSTVKVPMEDDQKMGKRTFVQARAMFQWAKERAHIAKIQMKERDDAQGLTPHSIKKVTLLGSQ